MEDDIAILVDGDNISVKLAGQILRAATELGNQRMRLAYCNSESIKAWSLAASFRTVHAGSKPNGADILLSIQAMEFALSDSVSTFVLASSDGDLCHIAHSLRERGRRVIGMGEDKAPGTFRLACSEFIQLKSPSDRIQKGLGKVDQAVLSVLGKPDYRNGLPLPKLNNEVRKLLPDFSIRSTPEKAWEKYLGKHPEFYTVVTVGKEKRVHSAEMSS